MSKIITTICLDMDLKKEISKIPNMNLSETCNEYLWQLVRRRNKDIDGLNQEKLELDLQKKRKEFALLTSSLKDTEEQLEHIRDAKIKEREEEIKQEEEFILAQKTCSLCGKVSEDAYEKYKKIGKSMICNVCYRNLDGKTYKKLLNSKVEE